jgi:peptidylprolyl isomerase
MKRIILLCVGLLALGLMVAACGSDDDNDEPTATAESNVAPTQPDGGGAPTEVSNGIDCTPNNLQYDAAPEVTIDASKTYVATIKTARGDIVVELDPSVTVTTNNFVFLAREGYYDCLTFHRVEPGFVIQGGDPLGNGTGGPGYGIPGEFEGAVFDTGVIGMARSADPNSAGSQFYIMLGRSEGLDGSYAAFGHVTSGQDVAESIQIGDVIETITIDES